MFKKLPSNKPDTTVFREIKEEFSPYFEAAERKKIAFLNTYPKQIFIGMVILIVFSFILSFWIMPDPYKHDKETKPIEMSDFSGGVSNDFDQMMDLGERAYRLNNLKKEVEIILQKESLSREDSLFLEAAIIELEHLNNNQPKY